MLAPAVMAETVETPKVAVFTNLVALSIFNPPTVIRLQTIQEPPELAEVMAQAVRQIVGQIIAHGAQLNSASLLAQMALAVRMAHWLRITNMRAGPRFITQAQLSVHNPRRSRQHPRVNGQSKISKWIFIPPMACYSLLR